MSSVLSNGQLTVPDGLPAALESLARAVLKEQPTDLGPFSNLIGLFSQPMRNFDL